MAIIDDILENDKKIDEDFDLYKEIYWEKKVEIVAKIAEETGLLSCDISFWKEQPAIVVSVIYRNYRDSHKPICYAATG